MERRRWKIRGELELLTGGRGAQSPRLAVASGPLLVNFEPIKYSTSFTHLTPTVDVVEFKEGDVIISEKELNDLKEKAKGWFD